MTPGKTKDDYADDYSEPELRERLKEEIKAADKGGRPGQWSARKSQLLVHEYEKAGGGYRHPEQRSESQAHLREWGDQDWHGTDGKAAGGRYLPDAAWQLLSEAERDATDQRKRGADEQFVANTDAAREARAAAELLDVRADEAVRRVGKMTSRSALARARRAEEQLGKGRKTVLTAIERRRERL